ncbi:hypothetical protein CMI37_10710 [Candidatus Pacearchaeota archaeon]|nr:hypothetical protein [Candidatus Pacearchaeota archaeon]|tara:strand:+ start:605 stop:853 length:249 start_codon:yes stop_codon:yes gene_type:complete
MAVEKDYSERGQDEPSIEMDADIMDHLYMAIDNPDSARWSFDQLFMQAAQVQATRDQTQVLRDVAAAIATLELVVSREESGG